MEIFIYNKMVERKKKRTTMTIVKTNKVDINMQICKYAGRFLTAGVYRNVSQVFAAKQSID